MGEKIEKVEEIFIQEYCLVDWDFVPEEGIPVQVKQGIEFLKGKNCTQFRISKLGLVGLRKENEEEQKKRIEREEASKKYDEHLKKLDKECRKLQYEKLKKEFETESK